MWDRNYNAESAAQRIARLRRAHAVTTGPRGIDGLTERERRLLADLKLAGYDLVQRDGWTRFITPSLVSGS